MKTRLLTFLAGIIIPLSLSAQWLTQDPGFTAPREIHYIDAVDQSIVWIVAKDASGQGLHLSEFSRTTDGGTTWTPGVITTEELEPAMIFALDDQVAYVLVYKGSGWTGQPGLFATFDGGVTWSRQNNIFTDPTAFPDIVHFFDYDNGVAIGDPVGGYFDIYITINGGTTWTKLPQANIPDPLTDEAAVVGIYYAIGNTIWFASTEGRMFRSKDMGYTWSVFATPFSGQMRFAFIDEDHGVLSDHDTWQSNALCETFDGGETWTPIIFTGPLLVWDFNYIPGTVGTLVTTGAYPVPGLSFSINAGQDWHWAPNSEGISFFHSDWINNTTGWAGGFNNNTQRAFMNKYSGPGLTDLIFSNLSLDFGDVDQGETVSQTVTISNYGENIINLSAIYTDNMDFYTNTPSAVLYPGESVNVEVIFQTSYIGLAEGHLIIESDHSELSYIDISLAGTGVDIPDILTEPTVFDMTSVSGEKQFHNLTLANTLSHDIQYSMSVSPESTLPLLGWNYGSTPLNGWSGILDAAPDQAMFIKEFVAPESVYPATLYLGFDDGCRVWINGQLACDFKYNSWSVEYWNEEVDVSSYIQPKVNRISVVVFNGVYAGGGGGGFDCQLNVGGVDVIKRGDQNPGSPEAMWYYYGQTGMLLMPPEDINQREWWEMNYGRYDWLRLARATGQQFLDLGWNYESTPVPETILNAAPDMAQFVKDIVAPEGFTSADLYLGFDDGCRVWINGKMMYDYHYDDHGLNYWDAIENISGILISGRNRIAVEAYNGIWAGGGGGNFDCQLTVDGVDLIKRGDQNPGAPEAMWYMYGQGGQQLIPPDDYAGTKWMTKDYAFLDQLPSASLSGTINVGYSENFIAVFDATGLPQGAYSTNINVDYSLFEMLTQVPVTLNVMDGPHCKIQPGTLDYGDIYYGYPETMNISVSNTGSETLNVLGIFCDNMYCISADPYSFSLEPGESTEVNISYTNDYDDKYIHRNLYLDSNDPLNQYTVINLMAYGGGAPELVIPNVNYMFASLLPDGFESQNLHIENWAGPGPILNFTLPQAEPLKNQNKMEIKPLMKTGVQSQTNSSPVIQRDLPEYYTADIKSHKNLIIECDNGKSGVAGGIELFYDEMENGPGNWTMENYRMTDIQWHLTSYNTYSSSKSWWCGNETTADYDNDSTVQEAIISPSILLPPVECNITLEFHEMWEVEGNYDQCYIDISTDGGYNWDRIREGIPGSSEGWITTSLNISNYWNQTVKIRFFFDTGDDVANNFPGWFIDDVKIFVDDFNFLSLSPESGSINGGEGFDVTVNFNASGYSPGYYPGFILILSNDPDQPQYYLPANMEVNGSPQLEVKVALEGPYHFDGSVYMRADLIPVMPLDQPFNGSPWNYPGTESVSSIPNTDIVDWVLLEFRDAPDAQTATQATIVGRQAAFLRNNAMVVNLDGYSRLPLNFTINDQLFVVVWHRNHLGVMTAEPVIPAGSLYSYDFTTGAEKAYGTDAQKDIGDGFFGMYAGDLDASGSIDNNDKTITWKGQSGKHGYLNGDADLNTQVDNNDKNDNWLPNFGRSSQVPASNSSSCGGNIIDSRDGQSYPTVLIGTQCWMAKNLNIGTMITGTSVMSDNLIIEKYCYNNNTANCDTYGGLYNWTETMQYVNTPGVQGICPDGWHLPTEEEWCTLTQYLDPTVDCEYYGYNGTDVGIKMKTTSGWNSNGNGTNTSGFSGLPVGHRVFSGGFYSLLYDGYFWSSTEYSSYESWRWTLVFDGPGITHISDGKSDYGNSVRCVKN
jgi:uncharacterized protein (TIGR02145 family)